MNKHHDIVCFGEVLWDILPSATLPGGAPMNVAYHLQQHKINTAPVTSIGNDEAGEKIKTFFKEKGICTDYFFVNPQYETGKVYATANANNDMSYEIVQPVAWDFIPFNNSLGQMVKEASYFVYGSLASRSAISRNSLLQFLELAPVKVMDINLRPPHFSKEGLLPLLQQADILKLNEEELALVGSWFGSETGIRHMLQAISSQLNIPTIIVTLGANGAMLFTDNQFYEHPGYKVQVADTIGSGDAFLAGFLFKTMNNASPAETLDYACRLGAFVASKKGGCPSYELEELQQL